MAWIALFCAGLLEIAWATGLKYTEGFTRPWPTAGVVAALGGSMYLLALAVRELPIGTAYAVWVGIGALGAGVVGVWALGEPLTAARAFFFVLLLVSIIGLKLTA